MAINRASIAKELLPGLNAVFGIEYGEVDNEHQPLFDIENSDRAFEEEVLFTGFGTAPVKSEGASISYDNAQESYTARYVAETVALAFAVTEEAMEDNLYDTFAKLRARGLARAMANTKQVKGADIFNNGFTDVAAYQGGDGEPLFSASHPTVGDGNQSNSLGAADLSFSSLEAALTTIQKIKDDRGILTGGAAVSLHVSADNWATSNAILNSTYLPASGAGGAQGAAVTNPSGWNDINSIQSMSMLPKGVAVNRRFTDTDAWFVKTNVPNGTKMFNRTPLQTKMEPDFDTGNLRFKARERYSFGWSDWRGFFGNSG
jgi:hypothetical protein|tara:strand:- start:1584 stop:2534 length:951 start_codon:yes stop_codon:yes gene_type:complete